MTLLDKLWDDTVAGPRPDSGLGKLRKYHTFSSRSNSGKESSDKGSHRSAAALKVTTSVRPPKLDLKDSTPPVSPTGSPHTGGDDVQVQVEDRHMIGTAGEERGPFRMRKQMGLDPIALLLLTCDL